MKNMLLIGQFTELRKDLLEMLAKFPEDKEEEVLFHEWSLKDVLAHLVGWDVYFTNALKSLEENKQVSYWIDVDERNKKEVEKRKNLNYSQIYEQFIEKGEEFISRYGNISGGLKDEPIWPDKKYTLLKFLKTNIRHYEHHYEK